MRISFVVVYFFFFFSWFGFFSPCSQLSRAHRIDVSQYFLFVGKRRAVAKRILRLCGCELRAARARALASTLINHRLRRIVGALAARITPPPPPSEN